MEGNAPCIYYYSDYGSFQQIQMDWNLLCFGEMHVAPFSLSLYVGNCAKKYIGNTGRFVRAFVYYAIFSPGIY